MLRRWRVHYYREHEQAQRCQHDQLAVDPLCWQCSQSVVQIPRELPTQVKAKREALGELPQLRQQIG